jgi:uncharacterized protein YbaP (TraB family)
MAPRIPVLPFALLVMALLPHAACATPDAVAPTERPFLYRIEGTPPSFLYGTVHVPDERVLALPRSVRLALGRSDVVVTEVLLDADSQMQAAQAALLPVGKGLSEILPPELYARARSYLEARGLPIEAFEQQKVWAVAMQLTLLEYLPQLATRPPLDLLLFRTAKENGKQVDALETPEEQIALMDGIGTAGQLSMLEQTLGYLEAVKPGDPHPVERLLRAYLKGDGDELVTISLEYADLDDPATQQFLDAAIHERNASMAATILAKLAARPDLSYLFAIGALHVPGPEGVKARLEKDGRTMTRLGGNDTP